MSDETRICPRCGSEASGPDELRCPTDGFYLVDPEQVAKHPADAYLGRVMGGRYPILAKIGAGGMGAVYLSEQPGLKRTVAVKVFQPTGGFDRAECAQRFEREAQLVAQLDHPSIVTVHEFGTEEDGTAFMVMEYVRGMTLGAAFRDARLTVAQLVGVCMAILDALQLAQERGLVHRDLKPENVMLVTGQSLASQAPRVKVLDFGLVKMLGSTTFGKLTRTGMVSGTPTYMAPEQGVGHPVDHRADLYSLGAMLYEGLAGHPPFVADMPVQIIAMKHLREPPPLPEGTAGAELLGPVVARVLARRPEHRYSSALEMAHALRAVPLGAWAGARLPGPQPYGFVFDMDEPGPSVATPAQDVGSVSAPYAPPTSQDIFEPLDSSALELVGSLPTPLPLAAPYAPSPSKPSAPHLSPSQPPVPPGGQALNDRAAERRASGGTRTRTIVGVVAGLVGLVVLSIVLAVVMSRPGGGGPEAPTQAGSRAAAVGGPSASGASADVASAAEPTAGGAAPTSASAGEEPKGAKADPVAAPAEPPTPAAPPGAAPPATTNSVHRIVSTPEGADVRLVGGDSVGTTPLHRSLQALSAGSVDYEVRKRGYLPARLSLPLEAGEHERTVRLRRRRPRRTGQPRKPAGSASSGRRVL